jgi:UTP--glucose-1-phosphate uridylyltransferase
MAMVAAATRQVCERTEADKKGGHLALRKSDGRLILRESAQCDGADEKAFQVSAAGPINQINAYTWCKM